MTSSCLFAVLLATAPGDPCDLPSAFTHIATSQPGDIEFTLAIDKSAYSPGQTAQLYYRVRNLGSSAKSWSWGVAPMNGFAVYDYPCAALDEPGCFENYAMFYPEVVYFYGSGLTVAPGECKVFTHTWDLTRPDWDAQEFVPAAPGRYRVFAGLWVSEPDWPGAFVDDSGLSLELEILASTSTRTTTWGAVKALFR